MNIYERLNKELKLAILNKDKDKDYIRLIKSKIDEYLVANRLDRSKVPNDEIIINVIAAYKKSLEKGIVQLQKGGEKSVSLISEYNNEIKFCEKYLPDVLDTDPEVLQIVDKAVKELDISDIKQAGRIVGYIMKNNKDKKLNGSMIKSLVVKKLQS
jgi:uncharacterized protein YqeY